MNVASWDWGDVPSWISVALTVLVPVGALILGYLKRNALGRWLTQFIYRTPPPPMRPIWSISRPGRNELVLRNEMTTEEGSDVPTPPKMVSVRPLDGSLHLSGAAWPSFDWGSSKSFFFDAWDDFVGEECEIVWQTPDRNNSSGWREEREDHKLPINKS